MLPIMTVVWSNPIFAARVAARCRLDGHRQSLLQRIRSALTMGYRCAPLSHLVLRRIDGTAREHIIAIIDAEQCVEDDARVVDDILERVDDDVRAMGVGDSYGVFFYFRGYEQSERGCVRFVFRVGPVEDPSSLRPSLPSMALPMAVPPVPCPFCRTLVTTRECHHCGAPRR